MDMDDDFKTEEDVEADEAQRVEEERGKQLIRAYQDIFLSSAEGQLVLWDLLNKCYVFRKFGACNATAYALEGKREIGLELLEMVQFADKLGGPGPAGMQDIMSSLMVAGKVQHAAPKKEKREEDNA